jgi:ComF family protein
MRSPSATLKEESTTVWRKALCVTRQAFLATFRALRFFFISLWDFVFPPVCFGCGEKETANALICPECLKALYRYPLPVHGGAREVVTHIRSLGHYAPPFLSLIHELKYRNRTKLAPMLGDALTSLMMADPLLKQADLLAPIPLHPARLRERGYNQSELLARRVSQLTGIPISGALRRVKNTKSQARIKDDDEARKRNIKGAFAVRPDAELHDRQVILIDDVTTTGATLNAAAQVLKQAGAGAVYALVVAQVPKKQ